MQLTPRTLVKHLAEISVSGPIVQAQLGTRQEPLAELLGPATYSLNLLLDLSSAERIDSSGISWLLVLHRRAREGGGRLILFGMPPLIDTVMQTLRMHYVFEIVATREEALSLVEPS